MRSRMCVYTKLRSRSVFWRSDGQQREAPSVKRDAGSEQRGHNATRAYCCKCGEARLRRCLAAVVCVYARGECWHGTGSETLRTEVRNSLRRVATTHVYYTCVQRFLPPLMVRLRSSCVCVCEGISRLGGARRLTTTHTHAHLHAAGSRRENACTRCNDGVVFACIIACTHNQFF